MAHILPFDRSHIPGVARLHRAVFRPDALATAADDQAYERYLTGVFLTSPVSDPARPSLVFQDDRGEVKGFIGVASRTIVVGTHRLRASVSTQFVVDPAGASGLVAVRLAKAYLEGPQDLSISDSANDLGRRIWERLGGRTDRLLSMHWTRPLRPARLALSLLRHRRALAPFAVAASPFATVADLAVTQLPSSQLRQSGAAPSVPEIAPAEMLAEEPRFSATSELRVEHEEPAFSWLLQRAARSNGALRKTVVSHGGQLQGWAVWYLDKHGTAEVLQLAATDRSIDQVLAQLFYETWKAGAVAASGRLDPRFLQALSDKYCLFHRRGPWTLVHARRPDLLQPFWTGTASFARLDGEWPLAFGA